jgi:hypothetical protein
MVNIVHVDVQQQVASAPSQLQRTGAFVSQGGTTLAAGTYSLITEVPDLTAILTEKIAITSLTWTSNVVTVVTSGDHGIPTGTVLEVEISGAVPTGYNGKFAGTVVDAVTITYPLATNPGASAETHGFFQIYSAVELAAMAATFFAQGKNQAVYVLELGADTVANGVASLATYIDNPELRFYRYLLPFAWDGSADMHALAVAQNGPTADVYFHYTSTISTYAALAGVKSIVATIQSPSAPITEFSSASLFQVMLRRNPGVANQAAPVAFTYVYGVTPYVLTGPEQEAAKAAGVNWIGTGAEGGISLTLILWGTTMDLNPLNYWYAVDWATINVAQALAAAIIYGSNLSTNPLYYNQAGINSLQKAAQAKFNNGISFGLFLGPVVVSAISFKDYISQNPNDYATGTYNGLSCTFVPLRGFELVTIYLTASKIPV